MCELGWWVCGCVVLGPVFVCGQGRVALGLGCVRGSPRGVGGGGFAQACSPSVGTQALGPVCVQERGRACVCAHMCMCLCACTRAVYRIVSTSYKFENCSNEKENK